MVPPRVMPRGAMLCVQAWLLLPLCGAHSAASPVSVDTSKAVHQVSDRFVSFTMDASETGRWAKESRSFFHNDVIIALGKSLAPAYFRYGGTSEDFTSYSIDGKRYPIAGGDRHTLVLNETIFDGLAQFAEAAGWDFVFGTNAATYRTKDGAWNSTPFKALLAYAQRSSKVVGWELGNEPDLFKEQNISISSKALAADFLTFRKVLQDGGADSDALVIGPDVAYNAAYLKSFLDAGAAPDVVTFHFYYGPGSHTKHGLHWTDFSKPKILDRFLQRANQAINASSKWLSHKSGRQIWVGETSSTYGGGTANASSSFIAGFMWLDKLGLAARLGLPVVCRQVFAHSQYSVIGYDNVPNPDYYSSLLWRRLVGTKVLKVAGGLDLGRSLRVYAFCSKEHDAGGVALVWLNSGEAAAEMDIASLAGPREVYVLTSSPETPTSRDVFLNGRLLAVDAKGSITTSLVPRIVPSNQPVKVPAVSYGFIVLPKAAAEACESYVSIVV
eukprot:TRINITY_DN7908_c0_g1_i1.p1 TRINITY_DN7908_c0_g1~~TRINITY_DN7908_c0_g1_i1.p1  ORF type:complete len:499 (-),score=60.24 TRINITY_DN7908_c0_g1_i1:96-1592(-)